jgi:hypothetical protein
MFFSHLVMPPDIHLQKQACLIPCLTTKSKEQNTATLT